MRRSRKVLESVGWFWVISLCLIGLVVAFIQLVVQPSSYNQGFAEYRLISVMHFIPGFLFMALGPLQFVPELRQRYPYWHRQAGKVFMASAAVALLSGLVMVVLFPFAGLSEQLCIFFFGGIYGYALVMAWRSIKQGKVAKHREHMIRVFAIGLGISIIRILVALKFALLPQLSLQEAFAGIFWLSFGSCWLLAEWWIRFTRS